ncbi:hypothetical protein HPB48_018087 [Haemaphysalis longicornis]|uniref:RNA 3'-terminal phosphate cyclase n=1 Tax=Haemaphysalis longicornis TaxID=44386 RepID=A0A9J6FTC0_HAELO|nr:hypothetical protein HPB48_018087 [Haemaphysalis longicornis]
MAIAFSALFRKPVRVINIRAGRSNPGLRPQHLTGITLVKDICGGRLEQAFIGSTEVTLYPGPIRGGDFSADTGTAGSVVLMLQVALPCLLFADSPSVLRLRGGTNADMAPQIDYTLSLSCTVAVVRSSNAAWWGDRRGYFPKGGGLVEVRVEPAGSLKPVTLTDPGRIVKITGRSFVAGVLPVKVAHVMADTAAAIIREQLPSVSISVERVKESEANAFGTGNGIVFEWLHVPIHPLLFQLIVFMALANGTSQVLCGPLTLHTETAIHVAHQLTQVFFPQFSSFLVSWHIEERRRIFMVRIAERLERTKAGEAQRGWRSRGRVATNHPSSHPSRGEPPGGIYCSASVNINGSSERCRRSAVVNPLQSSSIVY